MCSSFYIQELQLVKCNQVASIVSRQLCKCGFIFKASFCCIQKHFTYKILTSNLVTAWNWTKMWLYLSLHMNLVSASYIYLLNYKSTTFCSITVAIRMCLDYWVASTYLLRGRLPLAQKNSSDSAQKHRTVAECRAVWCHNVKQGPRYWQRLESVGNM